MAEKYEQNALIERVSIDTERCLSAWLTLDYGGSGQGFGGYVLFAPPHDEESRNDPKRYLGNYAGAFIHRCIEIGGVIRWEDLPGKTIRVRHETPYGRILAIGHIIKDDWFNPEEEFAHIRYMMQEVGPK